MLQVGHPCGLCNRLDVIATGYLLARERGEKELEVIWPVNNQMPASFHDLFTALPSGRVVEDPIDPKTLEMLQARSWAAWASLPSNYQDSEFYTGMLAHVVANAIPEVRADVSAFAEEHFRDTSRPAASTIGVHIRRNEPQVVVEELYPGTVRRQSADKSPDLTAQELCEFAQPLRYYEAIMKSLPRDARFFVSTDSKKAFRWLQARFGDRVFERPKVFDRTSVAGVCEWLVDLLLLSRCSAVIGTAKSSFSHVAARIGRRPIVRVKTCPQIPANWPAFSLWRWTWAYRHFLVESTFWRRWLFYNVRPYVILVPRVPARCMRIASRCVSKIASHWTPRALHGPPGND